MPGARDRLAAAVEFAFFAFCNLCVCVCVHVWTGVCETYTHVKTNELVCTSNVFPVLIRPGQRAMPGTLTPPSQVVPLPQRRRPALPPPISRTSDGLWRDEEVTTGEEERRGERKKEEGGQGEGRGGEGRGGEDRTGQDRGGEGRESERMQAEVVYM